MQINIGERIKELRKRDGRTQEALATALGVTAQAVSRWEANGGYPDMEILPSIANYFGVSIDELFGYDCERAKKVDALVETITKKDRLNNGEDVCVDECVRMAREGLIEFPGNEKLTLCLASVLYNAGYVKYGENHLTDTDGYDILDTERHKTYVEWAEAIRLYEKLLEILKAGELRHRATRELVQLYVNTGETKKAREIAETAPGVVASREMLLLNACDGRERAEAFEKTTAKMAYHTANLMVSTVMCDKTLSPEEAVRRVRNAIQILEFGYLNGDYGDDVGEVGAFYLYLSEHLWRAGERDAAFAALDTSYDLTKIYDERFGLTGDDRATRELPDVWPWWCGPDYMPVKREMMEDPRWAAWVEKCEKA